ncbi:MAG TPA: adenylate kinase [Bacteroidales bacterium]|jgi:adenylate kinase|nr:adenylate kinase [Bacteroidales bacterium]
MKHFIIIGPPGAGKGTQAKLIVEKHNLRHISTGDLLRAEIKADTKLGRKIKAIIDDGNFVPDEMVLKMVKSVITQYPDVSGFIFDGFPRTTIQASDFDSHLKSLGMDVNGVISIIISDDIVKDRIHHRAMIEDRKDDMNDEIIQNRIATYHAKTEPLIDYYKNQGKYHEIDGNGTIEEIFTTISTLIERLSK